MDRIEEINARLAEINTAVDTAEGDQLRALQTEAENLIAERTRLLADMDARAQLRSAIAAGAEGTPVAHGAGNNEERRQAEEFARTRTMRVGAEQTRSVLVSGGNLATPTQVHGINDIAGAHVSSILDMIRVVNAEGMSTDRVAYIAGNAAAAAAQTEGSAAETKEPVFAYIDITPTSVAVTAQISKQAKKQSPLNYKARVQEQAYLALRKKASAVAVAALQASTINATTNATVESGKGVINEKTLRILALAHGGDEGVGAGVLFLHKNDLIAFGDVRGSDKKPVYEITPDSANPNTGIIKDGGLSVRYCLNSNLTACSGTAQPAKASGAKKTMFYGDPMALQMDLFSDYEIRVSEDFAFTSLMDTIRGDVELGAAVVVKNGFVCLVIPEAAS